MLKELVRKARSIRRFYQDQKIELETLRELVDLARLSPSARNAQPLKYILSNTSEKNRQIFPHLAWAGYLQGWGGPKQGEQPAAYIIIVGDTTISPSFSVDPGIAAQSIMLGATEVGLAACMLTSIQKPALQQALKIPTQYEIMLVVALGKPRETVVIEMVGPDGNIKYWRDEAGVHHVPKRTIEEIILDF
jgi:nitroreductase